MNLITFEIFLFNFLFIYFLFFNPFWAHFKQHPKVCTKVTSLSILKSDCNSNKTTCLKSHAYILYIPSVITEKVLSVSLCSKFAY